EFLRANNDPKLNKLADVVGHLIFPHDLGTLPNREGDLAAGMEEYVNMAKRGLKSFDQIDSIPDGLRGLEKTRKQDLEDWMDGLKLDAVLFPTVADVGPADAHVNPASADIAWSNGVWVANGNLAIRHLGVPTVTVPMGVMADIGMPVGLTFAGRAYDDNNLLKFAGAFESTGNKRMIPPRTPPLSQ
ncbi:MAG: amidase family protein, partial [Shewanella sp.]